MARGEIFPSRCLNAEKLIVVKDDFSYFCMHRRDSQSLLDGKEKQFGPFFHITLLDLGQKERAGAFLVSCCFVLDQI